MGLKNTSTLLSPVEMARVFALLLCATVTAFAQTTSATDGSTPLGLSPGAPAGSYPLTGFENVNLFNGNLNFHLPMDAIQGRGSAQAASMLAIDTKSWRVKLQRVVNPVTGDLDDVFTPVPSLWNLTGPGLGPGNLVGRQSGGRDIIYCSYKSNPAHYTTLTRLTFTASDGTAYELRDQQTNGQPLPIANPCSFVAPTRGTVFVTADGSAATFISDTVIPDKVAASGPGLLYPYGDVQALECGGGGARGERFEHADASRGNPNAHVARPIDGLGGVGVQRVDERGARRPG